jgi:hypothetical protein
MAYTSESARRQLLDQLDQAVDQLALALAVLGEAYELVDERTAGTLEDQLFRPVQAAYAAARRTRSGFAARHQLEAAGPPVPASTAYSADPRVHLERALDAIEGTDHVIAEMQDSMLPVEVGDRELRDGLTEVRELIALAPANGRQLLRLIGR